MEVSTHYASLFNTLLCIFAFPLRSITVSVLSREVRDHEVSVVDRVKISLVCLLEDLVCVIVDELVEYAEVDVVFEVCTCCKDIVSRVVEEYLLRYVDTFCSRYVVDVLLNVGHI